MAEYILKSALVAEINRLKNISLEYGYTTEQRIIVDVGKDLTLRRLLDYTDTLEVKEVDYERELSKYVSNGIHRFFPNVDDDYCKMDSVIWQDYVIETAKYFFELGIKVAQKEE